MKIKTGKKYLVVMVVEATRDGANCICTGDAAHGVIDASYLQEFVDGGGMVKKVKK